MAQASPDRLTELGARRCSPSFWILLAGLSGVYLFTAFTDPTALGGQLVELNARRRHGRRPTATDGGDRHGKLASEPIRSSPRSRAACAQLSQQVAALSSATQADREGDRVRSRR